MYLKRVLIVFIYSCVLSDTHGANILGMFPFPGKSHFVMFEGVLKALAEKGHNVDVVSFFPQKKPLPRYNDISLVGALPIIQEQDNFTDVLVGMPTLSMVKLITEIGDTLCNLLLENEHMQQLKNTTKKYDVVLSEVFGTECNLGWGHYFKVPSVGLTSSVAVPWANDRMGNPDNPSYIPNYFLDFTPRMSFYERFVNTYILMGTKFWYYLNADNIGEKIAKQFFGDDLPDLEKLAYNMSLYLVNSHYSLNQARPLVPNVIEVGGVHMDKVKPLNQKLKKVINNGTKGVIYLSMGSIIRTERLPLEKVQAIFDVLAILPYQVLWRADEKLFSKELRIPDNIHFEKWMPQLDILCQPNVKLFISHGGLMSTLEATHCGVPVLGIPLFADQELNIRQLQNLGSAIRVPYETITKELVSDAMHKLLYEQKYMETAKRTSKIFNDRPLSARDTAVYWIEYIIRHKGAPHLSSVAKELYWFQYYLIDVAVVSIVIVTSIFCGIYLTFTKVFGSKTNKRKIKSN